MGFTSGPPFGCLGGGVFRTSKPIVEPLLEIFIPYPLNSRWTSLTCLIIFQRIKSRVLSDFYQSIKLSFEITLVILSESKMVFWQVCHRLFIDGSPFYLLLIGAGRKLFDLCVSVCLGVNGRRWPWPWLLSLSLFLSLSLSRSVDSEPAVSVSGQLLLCTCSWF